MTNEELVMQIKSGQTDLMDVLWSQVYKFVYKQAYQFIKLYSDRCYQLGLEVEDLQQESFFAIYEAIENYDVNRGVTFLTYAGFHLKKVFFRLTKMNYANWQKNTIRQAQSLDAPAYADNAELTLVDTLESEEDIETSIVDKVYLERLSKGLTGAISELKESWQEVIFAIYFQGLRQTDIAKAQGVTRPVIGQKHKSALEALKTNADLQAYAPI